VIYSTPNIPGHTYSWTVTGGVIGSGAGTNQITVNWGNVGVGTVTVTETNPAASCFANASITVAVQPLLIAYLYYTNTSCYGDIISFWDASVADPANPIVNYWWDFGDGVTSVLQNPTHQYLPPYNVTYTITLIVTNAGGMRDTIYDAVYVNPYQFIPVANIATTVPPCTYQPVVFNSSGSTTPPGTGVIIHWDWNFGDPASGGNNVSNLQNPTHVFTAPGTYNVFLEITNERYCKNDTTIQVTILQSVPTAAYTFSAPTCLNNPVYFTNQSTFPPGRDIVTWVWNFADASPPVTINFPASPDVVHTFPGLGPYPVSLTVINNIGCRDSISQNVRPDPSPIADFAWDAACVGDTIQFTNLSIMNGGPLITSYYWDFDDPSSGFNTSTLKDPTHVFSAVGTYNVMMVATNSTGCPDTIYNPITVFPIPGVEFTWNFGSQNNEIQFHIDTTITPINMIGNMISWNFGDGTFGFGRDPVHIYPAANTWMVTVTVTDTIGCSNSITHPVGVPAIPVAFFSSNSPVCDGQEVCFTDLSSVPSPPFGWITTWIWDYGDGSAFDTIQFPNNPNVCHTYATIDTFAVTLTVFDNNGYTASYTANVYILPNPVANFIFSVGCEDQIVQFTDQSFANGGGNIISWDWNFGDPGSGINNTSAAQNPSHIFANGDSCYNVRLIITNFNNCVDTIVKSVCILPHPAVDFTHDTACINDLVTFMSDTALMDIGAVATWSWDFGDGTPVVTDPITTQHLYINPGVYTVVLTITDTSGCMNTVSHTLEVHPLPVPNFTWDAPNCQFTAVQFTDLSYIPSGFTGYISKWEWDFGDGNVQTILLPTSPNIQHTFTGPGTFFNVRLTVWSNDSCTAFIEKVVNLVPAPLANFSYSAVNCAGQTVDFTDLSQTNGGGNIVFWSWEFGDPGSGINNFSNLQNPSHTYAAGGTYPVRLIVTNVNNCVDTFDLNIIIGALPVARFLADTVCLGTPTQFTDSSLANAASIILYDWDFGDGTPHSSQANPSHTYANYGVYSVTLTVTNSNGCIHDTTLQVLVNPLPMAQFTYSAPNCQGAQVDFTDLSTTVPGYLGQIVEWYWDFGDGNNQTVLFPASPNVSHTFGPGLSFTVTLTVTTSDSCEHSISHVINLIPAPVANFDYPPTNCENQLVQFNDLSQQNGGGNLTSWSWNFGDPASGINNVSSAQNPQHAFTTTGAFTVTLIVMNGSNCSDTIFKIVYISAKPMSAFSADTACFGDPTQFTDASIPNAPSIITYSWDFRDGTPPSNQPNPSHIYLTYGVFNVTLTVTNSNGCIHDTTIQVLVNPLPVAAFTFTSPTCQGAAVDFTDLSTTVPGYLGQIVRWTWDFGDGQTANILFPNNPNVSHVFGTGGTTFTVRLTVKTADSCEHFIEHVVNLIPSPIANFSNPPTSCNSQLVQFTDLSQPNGGGNITTWYWDFDDPGSGVNNNSSAQNPQHAFTVPGTFSVSLIVTNASNCTDTIWHDITIDARPVSNFTADTACLGALTSFTDQSSTTTGSIASYFWQFGDGQTSTAQNPTHQYGSAQVYNVTLTVTTTGGCVKDTTKQVLVLQAANAAFAVQTPACAGTTVQFTDLSNTAHGYITTWDWDFGDGNTVTVTFPASPNVTHVYNAGGVYSVTLTITTSDGCTAEVINQVTIIGNPLANFSAPAASCAMMPVQFTDLSQQNGGGTITQWAWDFGDPGSGTNNLSNLQNPVHLFSAGGSFDVQLIVTNVNGCKDTIVSPLTVTDAPVAQFTADTSCLDFPTQFTDGSTTASGTIIAWEWNFGDPGSGAQNTSTLQNPTHIFSTTGTFNVTLNVATSDGCENDTVIPVYVNPAPVAMFEANTSCVGTPTQFTDLSIAPGSMIISWFWDFGDGVGTSTVQNPTYTYTTWGTYNVTLLVTNLANCIDSIIIPVTARQNPTAAFNYTSFFCPSGQVNFQDQSQGNNAAIVDHYWIFEPGYTSNLVNPTYVYSITDTTYAVTLIVTDNYGCQDTIIDSVYVKPGMDFTFNFDTVCFGEPTHFGAVNLAQGDTLYSVQWNFGDPPSGPNNQSFLYNPTHIYTAPGVYTVKLKAWNSDNCQDSIFQTIQVYDLPQPDFSFLSDPCDSIIHLVDESLAGIGNIQTWEWHFGDGSAPLVITGMPSGDTSHLYTTIGQFNVTLITTNSRGCVDSITQVVERYPCIAASFDPDDTLLCANYPITFGDSSLPVSRISQWHWDFDDGQDTTYTTYSETITHTFGAAGVYSVWLRINAVVNGTSFADSTLRVIQIRPTPDPAFASPNTCLNLPVLFSDTSETFGEPNTSWSWTFGDPGSGTADTSTFANPSHQYGSPGSYDVKMIVSNRFGCEDSVTQTIRIFALPEASFSNTVACEGDPTYFTDHSVIADTAMGSWYWNFGVPSLVLDTSTLQNPHYIYPAVGDYTVRLIVQDYFGCLDTVDSTVTVSVTPLSSFNLVDNIDGMTGKIQLQNESTGATGYWWDFGNGRTSEEENPTVTYTEDGTYIIMLVSMNDYGCLDTTYYEYEVLFKGLYVPNAFAPTSTNLGVMLFKPIGVNLKKYHVQVYTSWNELLWESTLLDSEGRPVEGWDGTFDGNLLDSGTYMWKIDASFIDDSQWNGSDIGKGDISTMGTITLIR